MNLKHCTYPYTLTNATTTKNKSIFFAQPLPGFLLWVFNQSWLILNKPWPSIPRVRRVVSRLTNTPYGNVTSKAL